MIKIKYIILCMKNNDKEISLKKFPDRPAEKTSEEKAQEFNKTKEKLKSFSNSLNINKNSLSSSDNPLSSALEETARVNSCTRESRGRPSYL
jgi:hypothetical protein